MNLPANFRKLPVPERRRLLFSQTAADKFDGLENDDPYLEYADTMIESSVGYFPVPLGMARGVIVNGVEYSVPLATEESSVVAALNFAAALVKRHGGCRAEAGPPVMSVQFFFENPPADFERRFDGREAAIAKLCGPFLESMTERGGGFIGMETACWPDEKIAKIEILADVRDALGANLLNTLGEGIGKELAELTASDIFMSVVSNRGDRRTARAEFTVPVSILGTEAYGGRETARRIVLASRAAQIDPARAVTHNKGIQNAVSALSLATGNDTRAQEAAVHSYAAARGAVRGLSEYRIEGSRLTGSIEIPVLLASRGGITRFHPAAITAFRILGDPDSKRLGEIAAAVGLLQNFAALRALTSEGIQKGHMRLHRRKKSKTDEGRGSP